MQRSKTICVLMLGLLAAFSAQSQTITNPGYEDDANGWTITISDGDFGPFFEDNAAQSHSGNECLKFWSDTEHTGSAEQTLTGVPEGRYLVSVWAFGYSSTTMTVSADGGSGVESIDYIIREPSGNYVNIGVPVQVNATGNLTIKFEHTSDASINLQVDDWEITPIGNELIANPSFEFNSHGSFAGWALVFDGSSSNPFIEQDGADYARATQGAYGMRLGNRATGSNDVLAGTVTQVIRDVPAGDYTVSFDTGSWWNGDYTVRLDLNGNAGTPVAVVAAGSYPIYNYTITENVSLATAGDLEIKINFSNTTDIDQWASIWFDNVVLAGGGGGGSVPDVSGMTQAEATTALEDAGYVVSVQQEASDTVPAGQIIRTEPASGTELAEGETVTLVVSTGSASTDLPAAGLLGLLLLGGSCTGTGIRLLRKRIGR